MAEVLEAFNQNGRNISLSKFNFLSGGKKLREVMLQDCVKSGAVTVLVTLSQAIADPDIMKIVKGTSPAQKSKEEKKKQEIMVPKPKKASPQNE